MRRTAILLFVGLLLLVVLPVSRPPEDGPVALASGLERFEDCGALLGHLRAEGLERVGPYGLAGGGRGVVRGEVVVEDAQPAPQAASGDRAEGAAAPSGFSGTNIQELGVDEPDIVKTDGRRILAVQDGTLHVIGVQGAELTSEGAVDLRDGERAAGGEELFLAGERALVMASGGGAGPYVERSAVTVVDLEAMEVTSRVDLDGRYVSARLVDGVARIVLRADPGAELDLRGPREGRDEEEALQHNLRAVRSATLEEWLPGYEQTDAEGAERTGKLTDCRSTYRPAEFSGFGLVTVVTIDPANPSPREATSVLGDADVVYASQGSLYVTTTAWSSVPVAEPMPLREPGGDAVEPRESPEPPEQETEIHRFDIRDPQNARYVASGAVPGRVLNQWSLSEHDGRLRVATTLDAGGDPQGSESMVTVLETRGEELVRVGRVDGLGRGERIYAVRFMGDLGYVVTFREIDPLYVLDLSEPTNPRATGELKIPGYSNYLHPVGDGLLLGVGQDATEQGRLLGTVVSLFDVRDPADPRRIDHVQIPGASSEVERDHHAFLWWEPASLGVLPVSRHGAEPFQGAIGYTVREGEIREVARVTHPETRSADEGPGLVDRPGPGIPEPIRPHGAGIRRSMVIDGVLFTMSPAGVQSADLETFEERDWLAF